MPWVKRVSFTASGADLDRPRARLRAEPPHRLRDDAHGLVDLLLGRAAPHREAHRAHGVAHRHAHRLEHGGQLDAGRVAGGARGGGEHVPDLGQERVGLDASDPDAERVGQAGLGAAVPPEVLDLPREARPQAVAHRLEAAAVRLEVSRRDLAGLPETHDLEHVLRAGPSPRLVAGAVEEARHPAPVRT